VNVFLCPPECIDLAQHKMKREEGGNSHAHLHLLVELYRPRDKDR
jgi:hypothetical protein